MLLLTQREQGKTLVIQDDRLTAVLSIFNCCLQKTTYKCISFIKENGISSPLKFYHKKLVNFLAIHTGSPRYRSPHK